MNMNQEGKSRGQLGIKDLLVNSVDSFKDNILGILCIMGILLVLPMIVLGMLMVPIAGMITFTLISGSTNAIGGIILAVLAIGFVFGILGNIFMVAVVKLIHEKEGYMGYGPLDAIKFAMSKIKTIIVLVLLIGAIFIAVLIGLILIVAILTLISKTIAGIFAVVALLALTFMTIYIAFSYQAIAIHELGAMDAFKYSINIVRGRFANVFCKLLVIAVIGGVIDYILGLIFGDASFVASIITAIIGQYQIIYHTLMFKDYDQEDSRVM